MRNGYTLIEVMLALVVLGVGVAAAVRATGALTALTARSARAGRVAAFAERALETRVAMGCTSATGRWVDGALDLVWSSSVSGGLGVVRVRVHWPDATGMRVDTFVTGYPCP